MPGPRRRDGTPPSGVTRGGGGGRRNPELAEAIARGEPVYTPDDEIPEGQVVRRAPDAPDQTYEETPEDTTGEDVEEEWVYLVPGDLIEAKVHHVIEFDDQPSNFTYGITTRVLDGESEDEAFARVSQVVNSRVLDMAVDAFEHVINLKTEVADVRRQRDDEHRVAHPGRALRPKAE